MSANPTLSDARLLLEAAEKILDLALERASVVTESGKRIDDHQVLFCKTMAEKKKIIAVYEIDNLAPAIKNYRQLARQLQEQEREGVLQSKKNARVFAQKLNDICLQLVKKK